MADVLPVDIAITTKHSLIHIGSLDSFDITEGGKAAARCILDYFDNASDNAYNNSNQKNLRRAIDIYTEIIPNENFGGEYTALQWICRLLTAPAESREAFLEHPEVASWYELLSENDFAKLKEYLNHKYHFIEMPSDDNNARKNLRFLEDFILFLNPDRIRWEKTDENLNRLGIKKGFSVADVGCGPGYFTFKFADIVGDYGKVYAIETNPAHLEYLRRFTARYNRDNVIVTEAHTEGIGLPEGVKVDVIYMCSLFHVLYAALTEHERQQYFEEIIAALKPNARLIVVDNDLVEDGELPYHGPYIAKSLIISQLWHYGFDIVDSYQFTVQRYALIFEYNDLPRGRLPEIPGSLLEKGLFRVNSAASLVNYRIADAAPTAGFTVEGRKAAELFLTALLQHDKALIKAALDAYEIIIPTERIGDEYTAFVWFCENILADNPADAHLDEMSASYFRLLGANDFEILKRYLNSKYELGKIDFPPLENLTQISEYIAFNNPNRDRWERTKDMLEYINIRPGEAVADIGCGSGYFTYQFGRAVGNDGIVYATEINKEALSYVEEFPTVFGLNVKTIVNRLDSVNLPEDSVDTVFMCSMYHAVYIASIEFVKDRFIESIKKALRKDGRLIIVDNDIKRPGVVPYYGSAIEPELIISQLRHYGFKLNDRNQFVPTRYVLIFGVEC